MKLDNCYFLNSVVFLIYLVATARPSSVISDPSLLNNREFSNILIILKSPLDAILADICSKKYDNPSKKREAIVAALEKGFEGLQLPVIALLEEAGVKFFVFFIKNVISVIGASTLLIQLLLGLVGDIIVDIIIDEPQRLLPPPFDGGDTPDPDNADWGIKRIGAPAIWKKTQGQGIRILIIDTGVHGTHNSIKDNYVGVGVDGDEEHGWLDTVAGEATFLDENGHGTHCTATALGKDGVAPKSKWMACRCLDKSGSGTKANVLRCMEFAVCPTDTEGNNRDCSKTPHIVSMSLGGDGGDTFFNDVLKVWHCAGIYGVFAIGNEGPKCESGGSPGDLPGAFLSVGATDKDEKVTDFSSRGPPVAAAKDNTKRVVPNIVAPGKDIYSAWNTGNDDFHSLSGTSMATPHVSGALALLLSKNPFLSMEFVRNVIFKTAFQKLKATTKGPEKCGENPQGTYPNDIQGNGRIDVEKAFNEIFKEL